MTVAVRRPPALQWLPVATLCTATLAAIFDWLGVEVLAALLLLAWAIPGATIVRRLVIALPVLVGTMSMGFTVLSVLGVTADFRWQLLTIAILTAFPAAFWPQPSTPWADAADGWSAVTSVAVVAIATRSAFTWSSADVLARLASHTDAVRHITLGSIVERHDGYVTLASHMEHLLPGLQRYPQGGAGFLAVVLRAVGGSHPDVASAITIGYWVLVGVLGITVWLATTLAINIAGRSSERGLSWKSLGAASLVVGATGAIGPLFLTYELGYFAQEVGTVALLASLCMMSESEWRPRTAVILVLLIIGVAQSWSLLTPVVVTGIAWWWWAQPRRRLLALPALLAAPFIVFPFVTGPSPTKQLLATGTTPVPDQLAVAALIVGGGVGLVSLGIRRIRTRASGTFVVTTAAIMTLMLAVGIIELVQAGPGSAYYAIKLFVLLLLFAGIAMAAGAPVALRSGTSRDRVLAATTGVATTVVALAG